MVTLSPLTPFVQSESRTSPVGDQLSPSAQIFSTSTKRLRRKKVPGQPLPLHNCEFATESTNTLGQGTNLPFGPGVVGAISLTESLKRESSPHRSKPPFNQGDARFPLEEAMTRVSLGNQSLLRLPENIGRSSNDSHQEVLGLATVPDVRQASDNSNNLHRIDRECGLHVTSLEIEQESGLHVTLLEDAPDPRGIESVYILPGETEIFNEGPGSASRFYRFVLVHDKYWGSTC